MYIPVNGEEDKELYDDMIYEEAGGELGVTNRYGYMDICYYDRIIDSQAFIYDLDVFLEKTASQEVLEDQIFRSWADGIGKPERLTINGMACSAAAVDRLDDPYEEYLTCTGGYAVYDCKDMHGVYVVVYYVYLEDPEHPSEEELKALEIWRSCALSLEQHHAPTVKKPHAEYEYRSEKLFDGTKIEYMLDIEYGIPLDQVKADADGNGAVFYPSKNRDSYIVVKHKDTLEGASTIKDYDKIIRQRYKDKKYSIEFEQESCYYEYSVWSISFSEGDDYYHIIYAVAEVSDGKWLILEMYDYGDGNIWDLYSNLSFSLRICK